MWGKKELKRLSLNGGSSLLIPGDDFATIPIISANDEVVFICGINKFYAYVPRRFEEPRKGREKFMLLIHYIN